MRPSAIFEWALPTPVQPVLQITHPLTLEKRRLAIIEDVTKILVKVRHSFWGFAGATAIALHWRSLYVLARGEKDVETVIAVAEAYFRGFGPVLDFLLVFGVGLVGPVVLGFFQALSIAGVAWTQSLGEDLADTVTKKRLAGRLKAAEAERQVASEMAQQATTEAREHKGAYEQAIAKMTFVAGLVVRNGPENAIGRFFMLEKESNVLEPMRRAAPTLNPTQIVYVLDRLPDGRFIAVQAIDGFWFRIDDTQVRDLGFTMDGDVMEDPSSYKDKQRVVLQRQNKNEYVFCKL